MHQKIGINKKVTNKEARFYTHDIQRLFYGIEDYYQSNKAYEEWST